MLDAGLVLYVALLALFIWRWLSGWRLCGAWLEYANYCALLYFILLVLLIAAVIEFIQTAFEADPRTTWHDIPVWLKYMVFGSPGAACITIAICGFQTSQHVSEIRSGRATIKHDRAVQIIALPAVYGVMAMSSMARIFCLTSKVAFKGMDKSVHKQIEQLYISKSETCFWVGDLYEAWALYQFGKMTLDLIQASIRRMHRSQVREDRERADPLLVAHSAVEAIAWLGVTLFLLVCISQAGWSLYLLTFTGPIEDYSEYNAQIAQFGAAGVVASAGAIYNVHIVESTFHMYFEGYRPLLKFITVKIIVSFAFFQKGMYFSLKAFQETLPGTAQQIIGKVPLIGTILGLSENDFELFYDSLILYECILIALLHIWGWSAYEDWYLEEDEEEEGERKPLMPEKPTLLPGSTETA